jgi:MFS family permease
VSKGGFEVAEGGTAGRPSSALRRVLVPLALAQFICSFAGTNMKLIPPVYILTTLLLTDLTSRARAFGVISAAGGVGGASGPLIGGLITSGGPPSCSRPWSSR